MVLLLSLSFAILAGLAVSRFTKKLKLPHVTVTSSQAYSSAPSVWARWASPVWDSTLWLRSRSSACFLT